MLLSAKRSLLLLPAQTPGGAEGRSLDLLKAAATRLGVPMVSLQSANWRLGLATGRSQLVAAVAFDDAVLRSLPPGTESFQVIDCLAEAEQPVEENWATATARPVTAEMVVFEWLERGATAEFRDLIQLIK